MKIQRKNELLMNPKEKATHFAKKWYRFARMKKNSIAKMTATELKEKTLAELKEKMRRFDRLKPMAEKAYWEGHLKQNPVGHQILALTEMVLNKVLAGENKTKIKKAYYLMAHDLTLQSVIRIPKKYITAPPEQALAITLKLQEEFPGYLQRNQNKLTESGKEQVNVIRAALPEINLGLMSDEYKGKAMIIPIEIFDMAVMVHHEAIINLIGATKFNKFARNRDKAIDLLAKKVRKTREQGTRELSRNEIRAREQRTA